MADDYISKFDSDGVYQLQTDITDGSWDLITDSNSLTLTSYYIRGTDIVQFIDGLGETTYSSGITGTIYSICLNRDGSRLYFVYNLTASPTIMRVNYVLTSNMTTIGSVLSTSAYSSGATNCYSAWIDKNNMIWFCARTGLKQFYVTVIDLTTEVSLNKLVFSTVLGSTYISGALSADDVYVISSSPGVYKCSLNAEETDIDTTVLSISSSGSPPVDMKFMATGKLVCLYNDGTNSEINVRSDSTFSTIDNSLSKTGELFYHLLLDSNNRIYADKFEASVKKRYRWDSSLASETEICDRLGNNHYNEDDIGQIHSDITGAEV